MILSQTNKNRTRHDWRVCQLCNDAISRGFSTIEALLICRAKQPELEGMVFVNARRSGLLNDKDDVQQIMKLKALQHEETIEIILIHLGEEVVNGYLTVTAHSACQDLIRERKGFDFIPLSTEDGDQLVTENILNKANHAARLEEIKLEVSELMASLEPKNRVIIELRIEGRSFREIGEILGCAHVTVEKRFNAIIRRHLGETKTEAAQHFTGRP